MHFYCLSTLHPLIISLFIYCCFHVRNNITTDITIIATTIHPITLDSLLLTLSFRIFLSLATLMTATRIGAATIPLITELYTNALIGSMFVKLINNPIIVDQKWTQNVGL